MRGSIKIDEPDKLSVTITIVASLSDWKELKAQLVDRYPAWQLSELISEAVSKVQASFIETKVKP